MYIVKAIITRSQNLDVYSFKVSFNCQETCSISRRKKKRKYCINSFNRQRNT